MTTLVSYNILAGGYSLCENGARRTLQLTKIIHSAYPDIVGLVEAIHPQIQQKPLVVEELAEALGMELIMGGPPRHAGDFQTALLTRLPVIRTQLYTHPVLYKPLLEACVEETSGRQFTVFLTHLSAAFSKGRGGGQIRQREVQEILRILAPLRAQGLPHVLMGDFNSLAPGDSFKASSFVHYLVGLEQKKDNKDIFDGHPYLDFVVPPNMRFITPVLRIIPRSRLTAAPFDIVASLYAPRGSIRLLCEAGYIDCYRCIHPHSRGFTYPAEEPAGRIDFIFASPEMARCLGTCYVLTEGEGMPGSSASDHLAIAAEFGTTNIHTDGLR